MITSAFAATDALTGAPGGVSVIELFLQAHIVVQAVIVGLLLASVWSWAIIVEKLFVFRGLRRRADQFERVFWSGQSLEELYQSLLQSQPNSMGAMFIAAMREWKRSSENQVRPLGGVRLRVEKVMDVSISREMARLEKRLLFLATVGSTAPFVGLFGTVWGIMNAFRGLTTAESSSIQAVAPGISEALVATAVGLAAAIPAVIFYNKFSNDLARHASRMEAFADEFSAILSRQLDVQS